MIEIPEEFEMTSFFGTEPEKLDMNVPFYYNTVTYSIINGNEQIEVRMSPAYGDMEILWKQNNILNSIGN